MPRGRGGRRKGTVGKQYPNRSDLRQNVQPPKAPTGQPYGERKASMDAQRAVPLPRAAPAMNVPPPGSMPLTRESERPNEPLTAGVPIGPGPGPEALGMLPAGDPVLDELRLLYKSFPNEDLRGLIEDMEQGVV